MLAAGALALAVSAPALEPVHFAAEARPSPVLAVAPAAVADATLQARSRDRVASRAAARRSATRPAATALRAAQRQIATVRRAEKSRHAAELRAAAERRAIARREALAAAQHRRSLAAQHRRSLAERRVRAVRAERRAHVRPTGHAVRHRAKQRTRRSVPAGMSAVIAFARAQVGKRYSAGAEGPNAFDCSGFTKRAYARAGIRLPHSSGAQAARARSISRSAARPGDLVVGAGHVGIYMGGGMMIDAGNPRTGVVYRRMYAGLHIERL
ncbi:NlpC/P60 family protein [Couchioplanes caeruleus]|uniref:C40 family peptidase n=1 Tax=Couchioplanes caeruleus TaxID=56438 RepID=UPI0020BF1067|nr:NlpC/P60 family protein [Couchioplanes caeruleus]UQU65116.1 NlpC/P60 family protein [Couchioplanes caeruleus]